MGYSERLQDPQDPQIAGQIASQSAGKKCFCMLDGAPGFQGSSGLLASQQHFKPELCFIHQMNCAYLGISNNTRAPPRQFVALSIHHLDASG